jgi:hypothetical protein
MAVPPEAEYEPFLFLLRVDLPPWSLSLCQQLVDSPKNALDRDVTTGQAGVSRLVGRLGIGNMKTPG